MKREKLVEARDLSWIATSNVEVERIGLSDCQTVTIWGGRLREEKGKKREKSRFEEGP